MESTSPSSFRDGLTAAPAARAPDRELDVWQYVRILRARKWFLIATFLLIVGGVAVRTYTTVPVYKSSALVLIQPNEVQLLGGVKGIQDPIGEALSTQYQLIGSKRIAELVWRDLGLDKSISLGSLVTGISVEPQRGSRLVRVGFLSPKAQETASVANALVEAYMQDNRERATGITDTGLKRLRSKAAELRTQVEVAAVALSTFRREHPNLPAEGGVTTAGSRLAQLNSELITVESERIALQSELEATRESGVAGADSERFYELRLEIAKLTEERASLGRRLKSEHPIVKDLDQRLEDARGRLEQVHATALRSLESSLRAMEVREGRLRAEVASLSQNLDEQGSELVEQRFLVQEHDAVSKSYQDVVRRIDEIELASSTATQDMSVYWVERAEVPLKPVLPDVRKNLSMAAAIGLLAGIGLCLLVDYLDRSIKGKADVEEYLRLPVIGHVPPIAVTDPARAIELQGATDARSVVAEAFRAIRTGVSFGVLTTNARATKRVMVTSTMPRDGKTLVSVNLALALAHASKRVLLVDCDLRKPRVHKVFNMPNERGMSTILAGELAMDEFETAARSFDDCGKLTVLPSGPMPPNPADLLNTDRMAQFLEACEGRFDWVVLDAPPSIISDPVILSTYVRDVVFVVRSFVTPRDVARQACDQLAKVNARVIGVVVNNADLPPSATGNTAYGYGYGYAAYAYRAEDDGPAKNGKARTNNGADEAAAAPKQKPPAKPKLSEESKLAP